MRCIVLDKDSIRIADEVANLSTRCQGIVHHFALKTGAPHFCHVGDLGKTVSFTLSDGRIVHHTFRNPACDSRERSADESTFISEAAQSAATMQAIRARPSIAKKVMITRIHKFPFIST